MSKTLAIVLSTVLVIGAVTFYTLQNQESTESNDRLREIAIKYALDKESWESARADKEIEKEGGVYSVYVYRVPSRPGSYRIVLLDETGSVLGYEKGR